MKQYSFIKQSMPGLVARGASILATRVKMSRRPSGAVSSVLQRLGLQAAPPRTNVGRGIARGLGYGALAAPVAAYGGARAYGLSDEQIGAAIGDTALGLMGGVAEADDRSMSIGAQLSDRLNKNVNALLAQPDNVQAEADIMLEDSLASAREAADKADPYGKAYYSRLHRNQKKNRPTEKNEMREMGFPMDDGRDVMPIPPIR